LGLGLVEAGPVPSDRALLLYHRRISNLLSLQFEKLPARHNSPIRLYKGISEPCDFVERIFDSTQSTIEDAHGFFVTLCCELRHPVFADDEWARRLIDYFKNAAERYHFGVHAFCVMPDHFHALVEGIASDSDLLLFISSF